MGAAHSFHRCRPNNAIHFVGGLYPSYPDELVAERNRSGPVYLLRCKKETVLCTLFLSFHVRV